MAPKREEKPTGKLVPEVPKEDKIIESAISRDTLLARSQPRQTGWSFQLSVSANRIWISTFPVGQRATTACYTSATQRQHWRLSINHTPLLAAQANGCVNFCGSSTPHSSTGSPSEQTLDLCSLKSQPLQLLRLHNKDYKEDFYYNVDTFMDRCNLTSTTSRAS